MAAAVLYVKDLRAMRTFYEQCFGLSATSADEEVCALECEGWELTLVVVPGEIAAAVVITDPPARRSASPVKLAFDVVSLEGLDVLVTEAGGRIDPIDSAWTFRGLRHLDCVDPEGNVVQMRQRLPR